MKKTMFALIVIALLMSGCSEIQSTHADNTLPADNETKNLIDENKRLDNEGSNRGDIEEDVNASDLKEDEDLTEIAEEEHKTEEDTLVPQEEVEEEKQNESEETQEQPIGDIDTKDTENVDIPGDNANQGNKPEEKEPDEVNQQEPEQDPNILNTFDTELPTSINLDIKYHKYHTSYDYLLVLRSNINVREKPTTKSKVVKKAFIYEKLNLAQEVKGQYMKTSNSDKWYKVFWKNKDQIQYGYVFGTLGQPRKFQFDKMEGAINTLKNEVDNSSTAYISNYKDRNGRAPLYNGAIDDKYGVKRYQAAPAYLEPNTGSEFRYISDGTLVTILDKNEKYYKVRTLNFEGEYWVPKKYVTSWHSIKELTKAVVVDRKNQNEAVFEYKEGKWNLISYVFATTGAKAKHKEETSLGYYMAIQTRERFMYLDDETREVSGYAPYATRFNGGAYIHGVPVQFKIVEEEIEADTTGDADKNLDTEAKKKKKRIDPGLKEYLYTIGSTPRSHKCVRNYTSHAKFIYDWIDIGKTAVIVIE
ncbi:MAG: L,D-transpeptidase family protein [Maledivibacter sp.]|jgi:hypothetical protein|nr:L,D-transpeptidase family protein [Maledivibacter sp.]